MRNSGSHAPFGSIADLTSKPVNRRKGTCEQCGCGLGGTRAKRFCGPCYDIRLEANIAKNRAKYRAKKQEIA